MNDQQSVDLTFLALTLWREARGESEECLAAIAGCILNRVSRPSWWGNDIMSVLFKKWQFSSLTDPKDGQLTTWPTTGEKSWVRCLKMARCAIQGVIQHPAPGADHYYDISIPPPKWADPKKFVRQIGRVRFYDLDKEP